MADIGVSDNTVSHQAALIPIAIPNSVSTSSTFEFPGTVDQLFDTYIDTEILKEKMIYHGARNIIIEVTKIDASRWELLVSKEVPSNPPKSLKRFSKEWQHVTQNEFWHKESDDNYRGEFTLLLDGVPVSVSGEILLSATESGSQSKSIVEVECNIPFLGNTIEDFSIDSVKKGLKENADYLMSYIFASNAQ